MIIGVNACVMRGCTSQTMLRYRLAEFAVLQCRGCGMMYRHPFPSEFETQKMYEDDRYVSSSYFTGPRNDRRPGPEVPIYKQGLEWFESRFGPPGTSRTFLDVGGGTGLFLSLARARGWNVKGVDLSRKQADRAMQRYGVDVMCGDFLTVPLESRAYDAITMWDLLEHVSNPDAALDRARSLLVPGGYLLIFTVDCSSLFNVLANMLYRATSGRIRWPAEGLYDAHHNFYFTRRSLTDLIERSGFRIEARKSHRAHLDRWIPVPIPLWIRLGAEAIDLLSVLVDRQYRQLVFCSAVT